MWPVTLLARTVTPPTPGRGRRRAGQGRNMSAPVGPHPAPAAAVEQVSSALSQVICGVPPAAYPPVGHWRARRQWHTVNQLM